MAQDFPDFIFNSPQDRKVLWRVFASNAAVIDLNAYQALRPGLGRRMWDMFVSEREFQKWLRPREQALRASGYIIP